MITFTYRFIVIHIVEKRKKGSLLTSVNSLMTSLTDLNGISQANKFKTMAQEGIINIGRTETSLTSWRLFPPFINAMQHIFLD